MKHHAHHIHQHGAGGAGTADAGLRVLQAHRWHHAAASSDLSSWTLDTELFQTQIKGALCAN
jgi:hypothetical protein